MGSSLDEIGSRLIRDANARGGFDNVTVVLFQVVADEEDSADSVPTETMPRVPREALGER